MAVLSKIRERSVFLIIIIAMALFAFVLSGLFDGNVFNKTATAIGEVNGETIDREEFAQQVELYRSRSNGVTSNIQNVNNAWNSLVREKVYETQLKKSGVIVGEKDIWDALISQPAIQNSPQFKNEAGLFDSEKLKEYIATLQEDATSSEQGKAAWASWINYEKSIKNSLEQNTYNALIKAGLSSTLLEGEQDYFFKNTSVDADYVYVPYSSIPDSLVTVSEDDVKNYIKKHANEFKAEASRDIEFVAFNLVASQDDENAIQKELNTLLEDREEYSSAAKSNVNVVGFKNATDMAEFNAENESDTPFNSNYVFKGDLPKILQDSVFSRNINDVYGPYKAGNSYKISKVVAVKQLPDSVRASHILLPFTGSSIADPTVTQTEAQAMQKADSILTVLKADQSKFESLAKELSADKVSGAKGGDLDWFTYKTMIPEFRDYVFENKVGDMGIVKSQFGIHIIKIDGQKNKQRAVQIATFTRDITPSETTENHIFEQAETLASDLSSGQDLEELAKENNYQVRPVYNLEVFDDNITGLGSQRQIVRWAFEENTNEGDIKRFDTDKGYAVVRLKKKNKAGYSTKGKNVRGIVLNQKKAAIIKDRTSGNTLEEMAKENNTTVKKALAISNTSPVFSGEGRFVDIAGVLTSLDEGQLARGIEGKTGVVFASVTKKNLPTALNNYNSNKKALERELQNRSAQIYQAIKDNADIEDNRAFFY